MSDRRVIIRKPGRPKGSHKLPPEYLYDLVHLLDLAFSPPASFSLDGKQWNFDWIDPTRARPRSARGNISQLCRKIRHRGGVRWVRNGVEVAKITDAKTLRARLYEAWRLARKPMAIKATTTIHFEPVIGPATAERSTMATAHVCCRTVLMVGQTKLYK